MPMSNKGLNKLAEECAELVVVKEKIDGFGSLGFHWDNPDKDLKERLEDEIADVRAAMSFVTVSLGLDDERMWARTDRKLRLFLKWDKEE